MSSQIDILFPDLLGLAHGKTVPAARRDHPTHYAITVMVQGLDLEFLETPNYSTSSGFPDMEARFEDGTLRPWGDRQVGMALLHFADGRPLPLDSRRALRSVMDRWSEHGLTPVSGYEMEFFLLAGRTPLTKLPVPDHRVYGIGPGADPTGTLELIAETAEAADLKVEGVNSEFTPSQVEVSLHYQDAMSAADAAFLFRILAREVARRNGIDITFMARPFGDAVGSGMHVNMSLNDASGRNALIDESDTNGLSDVAKSFVAGLLDHHKALAAFAGPTVNSYKRLVPGMLSGYWANWGLDNRISTVRIPGQRGATTRIEHRMADGAASPHLLTAALFAAGLSGVERNLTLPEPQVGDADSAPNTDRHTPHSLSEALDALEADSVLCSYFHPDLIEVYLELKRRECGRWVAAVTDWEQNEYSRVY
ncbi:MAG: glutamine synthetase [Actinobacteria bacterium]|nr:glutamine synthetase [Actinomycetota bacterium]